MTITNLNLVRHDKRRYFECQWGNYRFGIAAQAPRSPPAVLGPGGPTGRCWPRCPAHDSTRAGAPFRGRCGRAVGRRGGARAGRADDQGRLQPHSLVYRAG